MFLVLIEIVHDTGKEWNVVAHGAAGLRSTFPTREAAEAVAVVLAERAPNKYAVIEIESWYMQETCQSVNVTEFTVV